MDMARRRLLTTSVGVVAAFGAGACGAGRPDAAQASPPVAGQTTAYRAAYATILDDGALTSLLDRLRTREVLFVPGFFAQVAEAIGVAPCFVFGRDRYFHAQRDWLAQHGIACRYLSELESEGAVAANGDTVAKALADTGPEVVLVTHSKGCLDSLDALIRHEELRRKVVAWVALQGPFRGASLADGVTDHAAMIAGVALRAFGGSLAALSDMRHDRRREYQAMHEQAIGQVLHAIPTLCYASMITGYTCLSPLHQIGADLGEPDNDGLVSPASALLEGAMSVVEPGVDHLMPVLGTDPDRLDPVRRLAALLSLRLA